MAEFMCSEPPTEAEADMWGLTQDEACGGFNEVWPENWRTVEVFIGMATQWRVGPAGKTGLDYPALQPVLRLMRIPRAEWTDLFNDLRTMESAALDAWKAQQ